MRDTPDVSLASTIIRNISDDEPVPVHQKVTSRTGLAEEFDVMLGLKQTVVTQAHIAAAISDNRIVSSKGHALSKMPEE